MSFLISSDLFLSHRAFYNLLSHSSLIISSSFSNLFMSCFFFSHLSHPIIFSSHLIFSLISSHYFLVFTSHLVPYHFSILISSFLILLLLLTSSSCLCLFRHSSSFLTCFFFFFLLFFGLSHFECFIISSFSSCFSFPVFTSHLVSVCFVTALHFQSHTQSFL